MIPPRHCYIAVFVGACGLGDDNGHGPDGRPDPNDAAPHVPSTHFDDRPQSWRVPPSGHPDGFGQSWTFGAFRFWTTLDLEGDGFFDIAQTGDTAVSQRVWDAGGAPHWKVFSGTASGWATTSINWPVPPNGRDDGFFATGGGAREWATIDLDGDGRQDLVYTSDPATGRVWDATGAPHWKVYLGSTGGFAPAALTWAVPDSGTANGFASVLSETGTWYWALLDMNGDRRPDLIQTMDPSTGVVWDPAGAPHWKVFDNAADGFARQPRLWSVPVSGTSGGFRTMRQSSGGEQWETGDLDSDGTVDLIQTADPATGSVWDAAGAPYWKLFRGGADGFASASMSWRVPPSGLPDGFSRARSAVDYRRWTIVDLDGDGDADLIQSGDTSHPARVWDATGAPYWKVFVNERDGFSQSLHRWAVPAIGTAGFYDAYSAWSNLHWFVADVDHDGHGDLVHTMDPGTSTVWDAAGAPYWKVYRGLP